MTEPRLLTGPAAAAYLSISHATFSKWVAAGTVPAPVPNTRRWDRKALDLALDKVAGIVAPYYAEPEDECPLEKWKREDAAKQGAARAGDRNQAAR